MAEMLLFHHALGRTPGFLAFADTLRRAGHTVHTPDLFAGRVFDRLEHGLAHAQRIGFEEIVERGVRTAQNLPSSLVYAGVSLGVMPAQKLAMTRPDARGALLLEACVPLQHFGGAWPAEVPVQIHGMDRDPVFAGDGDLDAAQALVKAAPRAELFLYPGDRHLFIDSSLPSYEAASAALLTRRVLAFLDAAAGRGGKGASKS
jgi:dienelactone hydrolase